ncbi:unnamed protein product, partial [Polarella glacialis]
NIGLMFLSSKYLNAKGTEFNLNPAFDSYESMRAICAGLLGDTGGEGGTPELLDDQVKVLLRAWLIRLESLQSMRPLLQGLSTEEMAALTLEVNAVTHGMDLIVQDASAHAQTRVETLLLNNAFRAFTAVIWSLATMFIAGKLWNEYLVATDKLAMLTAQYGSLLKSSYDAVIQVSTKSPFEVLEASAQLDHMIGRAMDGQSILKFVPDASEKSKLEEFLKGTFRSPTQPSYFARFAEAWTSCWRDPSHAEDTFRLSAAKVLRTACTFPDGSQRTVDMELSLASFLGPTSHHLLAVRQVVLDDPTSTLFRKSSKTSSTVSEGPLHLPQVLVFDTSGLGRHGDAPLMTTHLSEDVSQSQCEVSDRSHAGGSSPIVLRKVTFL